MSTTVTTVTTTSVASNSAEGSSRKRTTLLRVEGIEALGQLPFMLHKTAVGHHSGTAGLLFTSRPSTPGLMSPALTSGVCTPFREMPQLKVLRAYDHKDPTDRALAFAIGARMKMLKKNNPSLSPHSPFLKAPVPLTVHSRIPLRMELTPASSPPSLEQTSYFDGAVLKEYKDDGSHEEHVAIVFSTPGSPWSAAASAGHTPGSIVIEMNFTGNKPVEPSFQVTDNSFNESSMNDSPLQTPDSSFSSAAICHDAEADVVDPWIFYNNSLHKSII